MHALAVLHIALTASTLTPMPVDTPPAFPASLERLAALKTMQDVIAVTLLADGKPAPADIMLPQLENRRHTLDYMRVHYPESARSVKSSGLPVAWVHVDAAGKVAGAYLLTGSGHAELDTLSLSVMRMALFKPARVQGKAVSVWVPMPARVPPYDELISVLQTEGMDIAEAPQEVTYTQKPVLINRDRVEAAILRVVNSLSARARAETEVFARAQNAGGTAYVNMFIDQKGNVQNALIAKTSGNSDLDSHALNIARIMRFSPARNGDEVIDMWIQVPIQFRAN